MTQFGTVSKAFQEWITCTILFLVPIVRTNKSSGIGSGFAGSGSKFGAVSGYLAAGVFALDPIAICPNFHSTETD